jgi:hypothetical protein
LAERHLIKLCFTIGCTFLYAVMRAKSCLDFEVSVVCVVLLLADNYVTKHLFNIIGLFKSLLVCVSHIIIFVILEISING